MSIRKIVLRIKETYVERLCSCGTRGAKNPWGKSCRKYNSLSTTKLKIGSYNAKTLRSDDRLEELLHELQKITWDVIGLSEVRRPGEECIKLNSGHTFYYRGKANSHQHGVGLLINKRLNNNIMTIDSVSDRVLYLTLSITKKVTLKVVQVYAPTSKAPDEDIEQVYENVSKCIHENKTTYTIVTGDFNAKIGTRADDSETIMGNFGYGDRNSRGAMLIDFLEQHKLYHMGSFFQKRPERKWTWLSPGQRYKNEIDYVFCTHKYIVKDVSVLNGFCTGSVRDHRLIRANIEINAKLERYASVKARRPKIDTVGLTLHKEEYNNKYIIHNKLKEQLSCIDATNSNIDDITVHLRKTLCDVAQKVAPQGKIKRQKLKKATIDKLEERRSLLKQGLGYTDVFKLLCKETRKLVEVDIEEYREETVKKVIENHRGPKVFKKALLPGTQQITKLLDENQNLVNNRNHLQEIVVKYYQQLYKSTETEPDTMVSKRVTNVGSEDVPEITDSEIETALSRMKNGKAAGSDNVLVEMVKAGGESVIKTLNTLFNKCLEEGKIPEEWQCANVILLFKKGNRADLNNYRPISLLSQLYKLLTKILTIRLTSKLDFYQPKEQAGFRSGYSTMDHILTLRIVIEKTTEYNMPLWLAFIDYKKAFDSVETWAIIQSLQNARIDHRYSRLVDYITKTSKMKVNIPPETRAIKIEKGVRQGDSLSPKLFTLVLEDIFKNLRWENLGLEIEGKRLNNLWFADDIVLLTDNPIDLQTMIQDLSDASLQVGLEMNLGKTKIMTNCTDITTNITVNQTTIDRVEKYIYLGQEIRMGKENQVNEISRRTRLAWAAYSRIEFALRMNITTEQKARIFDACILPVLTYGAETWVFTKDSINKLRVAQRAIERKLVGVTLRDRMTNKSLREQSKVTDVVQRVAKLKWEWAGHVARKHDSWCKTVVEWRPWGEKRPVGRPQMRWSDDIKREAGSMWIQVAQDRRDWHKRKEAYTKKMVEEG
ncbi:hypothetical protein ABMA28_010143 [Loxostege sticticalis]|uniref:Reverse transcriptase domain-containing protein n=1 Tax=Loxostege sticticalis TaxID=481309 RepID=A0ABD0SBZ5_LOXSC